MEKIIEIKEISKSFRDQIVLDKISLDIYGGRIYGIVGRNGSGKSVLFKCICGFCRIDKGEILVNGQIIGKDIDVINAGVIIETPGFLPGFSGYRNLKFLFELNHRGGKEIVKKAMLRVGLDPDSRKKVGNYSMGMKQRLSIAQAIMENQTILILDEPMNGLDKSGVEEMRRLFISLKEEGKTLLISSHNQEDIDILCDEVYEIDKGALIKAS